MRRFFEWVTAHPVPVLVIAAVLALVGAGFMLGLRRDTSPDAFIPPHDPAFVAKREADARFGLSDPIVVGVLRDADGGIFNPFTLKLIRDLTHALQALPGVASDDVVSLATVSGIYFNDGEPGFERLLRETPEDAEGLATLRRDVLGYELYRGTLVAADGTAAAILIRLKDEARADELYRTLRQRLADFPVRDERLVVAGEAAARAHMGSAVSDDALRMNFICPVVMAVLIALAYRTGRGVVLPLAVIGGASALALGSMAAFHIPIYIVTNGIFVIIMALGVADALHLIGQYYEEQLIPRGRSRQQLIVDACTALWFPVLVTSLTDFTGFLALYLTGGMPPIQYFGLFTCVGVLGALIYSYTIIPAGLAVLPLKTSRAFLARKEAAEESARLDALGRWIGATGVFAYRRSRWILAGGTLGLGVATWGAVHLTVNDSRLLAFKDDHPLVQASRTLNARFDGTSQLNIVVNAEPAGAFLQPDVLHRVAALEAYTETLPHVGGTHSIAGWVKRAHQKLHEDDPAYYAIPDERSDTQFYLDVLGAGSSPLARSLREVIDTTYTHANLIVRMQSSEFIHERAVVEPLQAYLSEHFAQGPLRAHLAGRVNLDYAWLRLIRDSHVGSVVASVMCSFALTALMFRSLVGGVLCTLTAGVAVLVNYAVMGLAGIPLGVGTSMFASIALGTGVNFPIQLLDRLRAGLRVPGADAAVVFRQAFAFTGRALCFAAVVVAVGFGLLCVSEFRTLVQFGLLVGLSMTTSFVASVTLLPAAVAVLQPRFLFGQSRRTRLAECAGCAPA